MEKLFTAVLLVCWTAQASAQSTINRVSLFKNGLAAIQAKVDIPESGEVVMADVPTPVNGTYWVQSDSPLISRITKRKVPADFSGFKQSELLRSLAGQQVELALESRPPLIGKVIMPPEAKDENFERNYASVTSNQFNRYWLGGNREIPQLEKPMVYIEKRDGSITAITPGEIRQIYFKSKSEATTEETVLVIKSTDGKPAEANVEYLTRGISWVPSYRLDISDPTKLEIRQKAVLRNELADLSNTEIRVISGFPSIKFASVDAPFAPEANWTKFFKQMVQMAQNSSSHNGSAFSNSGYTQIGHGSTFNPDNQPQPPAEQGSGSVDLHFQSLGRQDLAKGDVLAMEVARAESNYEQIVDWKVPDTRDADGQQVEEYEIQRSPEKYATEAWDAILFKNPFDFPMTTAAAMIVKNGDFQGQQQTRFTNPGEEITAQINKALSVVTRHIETEELNAREETTLFGRDYYRTTVAGELTVTNYRNSKVTMRIRREFSGKFVSGDEEPEQLLLEKGIHNINARNQLTWRSELKPGEIKKLKYRYEVLVRN
ncbi:MAG: hypothetical protein P1U89_19010 [Verrucomicrobiales bacterium]|nr:hypothetical protein [Verrucomicrobiales bacterium]